MYYLIATIPQTDGYTRYLLDRDPQVAREARELVRQDRAAIDGIRCDTIVDRGPDGRLSASRWPQPDGVPCRPAWDEIRACLAVSK